MITTVRIFELLFKTKRTPLICSKIETGQAVPTALARYSARRPKLASTTGPKISRLGKVMDAILMEKLVGIRSEQGVLVESKDREAAVYYDGSKLFQTGDFNYEIALAAIMLYDATVSKRPEFSEISSALNEAIEEFQTGKIISEITMGYFCDSFYYGTKDDIQDIPVEKLENSLTMQIQQAIRTGQFNAFDGDLGTYILPATKTVTFSKPTKKAAAAAAATTRNLLEMAQNGDFEIPYEWEGDAKSHIISKDMLDYYVPNVAFNNSLQLMKFELQKVADRMLAGETGKNAIRKNYVNCIFVGKPGTGKTTTAEALSAATGMPLYTVRCSKHIEEDEFEGMTKISKGEFVLKDTQFLLGFQNGGIIVLEEFNLADPAVMQGALGQAIEAPFMLMKDGTDIVRRHPLTVIIATMNVATQGSREPNEAFTSRLPFVFPIEDPKDTEFIEILINSSGCSKTDCTKVYKMYKKIIAYLDKVAPGEEFAMCITLRHCLAALRLMQITDFPSAIYNTMIGAIMIRDRALAEDVYTNTVLAVKS